MSKEIALKNLRLEPCERWAHTEFSLGYHNNFLARLAECGPDAPSFEQIWSERLLIDFKWYTDDGMIRWADAGRVTDMGHATYASGGSDMRESAPCPFATPEEVWAFDAVKEYGLPDKGEQINAYERSHAENMENHTGQLVTGGTYCTVVSGAIQAFGWEMLLTAASDPAKMERVLDTFYQRALFFYECWARTSAEAIITHDDFVWTSGAFMHPEFYREVIIPRYKKLWEIIHQAGKIVIFCSDGNYMEFARDVVDAGADALIFEPVNDFDFMVDNFGSECCLIGSHVDCRDLTFHKNDKVLNDIGRTFARLQDCRGAIVAVGNHLPANIPDEMMGLYFDALLPQLDRH